MYSFKFFQKVCYNAGSCSTISRACNNFMFSHSFLQYIHQNLASDITVSDIVKQVPLSRRLLEIRFKQVTQQSIHKYIFNLRMERFAQLLLATNAPIAEVAEQVGINNLKNLSRQFKALKKVSPNEYRKEHQKMTDCNHKK